MSNRGGYTHGMFTLLVPEDIALPMAALAREHGVSLTDLLRAAIVASSDPDFVAEVLMVQLSEQGRVPQRSAV